MIGDSGLDVRYALRAIRRSPMFAAVAIGTLAVGIAAVTTIFSFVNAVYFRPLPYHDADRIHAIGEQLPRGYGTFTSVHPTSVAELLRPSRVFERVAVYHEGSTRLLVGEEPLQLRVLEVDTSFAPLFQLRPTLGRWFAPDEILGDALVATISDTLWRTQFGADSGVIGRTIEVDAKSYAIVGVMQRQFRFPYQTDIWVPLPKPVRSLESEDNDVGVLAKLRPGISVAAAQADLNVIAARVEATDPRRLKGLRLSLRDEMLDRRARQFMPVPSLFLGAAFLVLLVACSNVANLFLARASERRREIAIRGALGAGRWRLIRQLLTESAVVGVIAGAIGTLLSVWFVRICLSLLPTRGFPSWLSFELDTRILAFSIATAFFVALAVGVTPATEGTRFDLVRSLKMGGDASSGGMSRSRRRGLVLQLTFAVVLFVGAALLVRSYNRILNVDLGYPADRIVTVMPGFDQTRYPERESHMRFIEELMPRAEALPGARIVAARGHYGEPRAPKQVGRPDRRSAGPAVPPDRRVFVDGDTTLSRSRAVRPRLFVVTERYFNALDLGIQEGRALSTDDVFGSVPVVVVSRRFAQQLLPQTRALGRTIQIGSSGIPYTVVGVVDDVNDIMGGAAGVSASPRPDAYFSARQARAFQYTLHIRTDGDVPTMFRAATALVRAADPTLYVFRQQTMASQVDESLLVTRVFGALIGGFAITALLLAVIGVYGLVAYGVAQRRREIGIRIALGGTSARIVSMFMRDGLRFTLLGVGLGLLAAAGATRLLGRFLFDVTHLDPLAYAAAAVLFALVSLIGCYVPARRASRVDPLVALRAD
jgi:putative ABC transport system permease protein